MSKRIPEIQEESAQDSFLDVIANLVGVIIILVMLVGTKATRDVLKGTAAPQAPVAAATISPQNDELVAELEEAQKAALAARAEVEKMATRLVRIRQETAEYDEERVALAMHKSVIEKDIATRREQLDEDQQEKFDVQRRITDAQIQLQELMQEQLSLLSGPEAVEELENSPAPIAREIDEDAIHLRLKGGLVSLVPLNELMQVAQDHFSGIGRRLQTSDQVTETYGPLEGYRIRVNVIKEQDPNSIHGPHAGQLQRNTYDISAEILPTSESIGQDVELATAPGGSLHQYLVSHRRQSPAVVIWVHTDSFGEFRLLKRVLWEMGFSIATKPLPPGVNIGISPHGTKAAVQ